MEFNMHDPPLTPSTNSSESYAQELPNDAQIPRFGPSNHQLNDMASYTTCEDPVKKSFMVGFG